MLVGWEGEAAPVALRTACSAASAAAGAVTLVMLVGWEGTPSPPATDGPAALAPPPPRVALAPVIPPPAGGPKGRCRHHRRRQGRCRHHRRRQGRCRHHCRRQQASVAASADEWRPVGKPYQYLLGTEGPSREAGVCTTGACSRHIERRGMNENDKIGDCCCLRPFPGGTLAMSDPRVGDGRRARGRGHFPLRGINTHYLPSSLNSERRCTVTATEAAAARAAPSCSSSSSTSTAGAAPNASSSACSPRAPVGAIRPPAGAVTPVVVMTAAGPLRFRLSPVVVDTI
ncbi:hypothetical protein Vafri_21284 [Volvox africanus]|uniref:Uncharacterized protein n=1 Tax=Volvox africanus TaxID=51714 RepID=A0A8J4BS23_9CHLO|nr:hypothetical protein Vafri_21284 [Volvox africanus]